MSLKNIVNDLVDIVSSRPKLSILTFLLLSFVIASGALKLKADFSYRVWFDESNPKLAEFDVFERRFGSDELTVLVVHSPSGIFDKESIEVIHDLTEQMWQVSEVIRVDSITNFNWVHGEDEELIVEPLIDEDAQIDINYLREKKAIALNEKMIVNYLINKEADTAIIYSRLKPGLDTLPNYEKIVKEMRALVEKFKGRGDHLFHITGNSAINYAFKETSQADFKKLVPFVISMTILFLVLSFKSLFGVFLPLVVVALTIVITMGATGWLGISINNVTAVVPQFMIAICIAVAVHLLVTFFQFYNGGMNKLEAIKHSAKKNFIPTLLTTISTSIGFFSFASSPIPPVFGMGVMAGIGTLASWGISYFVIVPLICLLPVKRRTQSTLADDIYDSSSRSKKAAVIVHKFRFLIITLCTLFTGLCLFLATKVEVNSDPYKYFAPDYSISIATDFVESKLGGASGAEIVIESGRAEGIKDPEFLKKVELFQSWIEQFPFVTKIVSVVDILKNMNKVLNADDEKFYVLANNKELIGQQLFLYTMNLPQGMDVNDRITLSSDALRITAMWTLHESKVALDTIALIEKRAKEFGLNAYVTGKNPLYQSNNGLVVNSFLTSLTLAVFLVTILLIIGLRSLKLGLLSMIPNTIPLIFGGGLVYVMGQSLDIGTVLVGSVCLGIAVDDTIHFLASYKKHMASGVGAIESVARVFTHTVPALFVTTLVITASFFTFYFGTFVPNSNFGIFVSSILCMALILDVTFLPALLLALNTKKE